MRKKTALILTVMLLIILSSTAYAAESDEDILTRGQFAELLVEAANFEGEAAPVDLLVQKGILKGYPEGDMGLGQAISRVEAVVITARALGLQDSASPPEGAEAPLGTNHWAYSLYSWCVRQGLVDSSEDPSAFINGTQAGDLLYKAFSTEEQAIEILEKVKQIENQSDTIRMVMEGSIDLNLRPGETEMEKIEQLSCTLSMVQEIELPDKMHQHSTITMQLPEQETQEITTELYLVDGNVYQQILNPETGEKMWYRFPKDLFPNLEEMLEQQAHSVEAVPPELQEYMHYRLLGTTEVDGEEVYEIAFYGRIDDFAKFMEAVTSQFGFGSVGNFQQLTQEAASMLDSMSYWGIQYVGVEDYLTRGSDYTCFLNYAEEYNGEPIPIASMEMSAKITDISFNEDLNIVLPEEALEAPELEIPEPELPDVEPNNTAPAAP